ncbi:hypothetical protein ABW21_db0205829 [Orbilia brochopaga]|nr:hypothetical protein ABW21_db0205829 [Drechslerella brochopaga]
MPVTLLQRELERRGQAEARRERCKVTLEAFRRNGVDYTPLNRAVVYFRNSPRTVRAGYKWVVHPWIENEAKFSKEEYDTGMKCFTRPAERGNITSDELYAHRSLIELGFLQPVPRNRSQDPSDIDVSHSDQLEEFNLQLVPVSSSSPPTKRRKTYFRPVENSRLGHETDAELEVTLEEEGALSDDNGDEDNDGEGYIDGNDNVENEEHTAIDSGLSDFPHDEPENLQMPNMDIDTNFTPCPTDLQSQIECAMQDQQQRPVSTPGIFVDGLMKDQEILSQSRARTGDILEHSPTSLDAHAVVPQTPPFFFGDSSPQQEQLRTWLSKRNQFGDTFQMQQELLDILLQTEVLPLHEVETVMDWIAGEGDINPNNNPELEAFRSPQYRESLL